MKSYSEMLMDLPSLRSGEIPLIAKTRDVILEVMAAWICLNWHNLV